jgi:hypothetical protein
MWESSPGLSIRLAPVTFLCENLRKVQATAHISGTVQWPCSALPEGVSHWSGKLVTPLSPAGTMMVTPMRASLSASVLKASKTAVSMDCSKQTYE